MRTVRFKSMALCLAALLIMVIPASAYVPTMRDTGLPEPMTDYELIDIPTGPDEYTLLAEVGFFQYYFRDDRDVFTVVDKRNGYTWKTGLDIPFNQDVDRAVSDAETIEEKIAAAVPKESRLNATFIGFANSVLTAEYYDDSQNAYKISSASREGASSKLSKVSGEENHYLLEVDFESFDLQVNVHIYLTEDGLRYKILDTEISGEGMEYLSGLVITPFLGASGGTQQFYNPETDTYGDPQEKPMIPGYVMIPDGSGSLIRFRENVVSFDNYVGSVYGVNLADALRYDSEELEVIPAKDPLAPVFGIAHGDRQSAFVFWADEGSEYLDLIVSPEEADSNEYSYAYPRFVYNKVIYQVYNQADAGYMRLFPERNHYDIDVTYNFLAGNGSEDGLPADYTGMALKYRSHLLEKGILKEKPSEDEMPIHFDFVMNDIEKDIIGTSDVVVTNTGNIETILRDLIEAGIHNINAGMMGAQSGGVTAGKPWTLKFNRAIGSKGDFQDLIANMAELGIDIYFTQNYSTINDLQMNLSTNMAYHRTNWGVERWIAFNNTNVPISRISFARPQKSAEWLVSQTDVMKDVGATSVGIEGISSRLISHYGSDEMSATEAISLLSGVVAGLDMTINAYLPNMYLWNATDRFINAPVLPTQYIIETDTVPFMQILLHGTMEMYAPYANFSFYSRDDILRMIDYNVFPSFVLTQEPAYLLASTNSAGFYSTSYDLYRDIILDVYAEMAEIYDSIAGLAWTGRDILQNGVVLNKYEDGTRVLINYTEEAVTIEGYTAEPLSAMVMEG